jgi:hypothetical protein
MRKLKHTRINYENEYQKNKGRVQMISKHFIFAVLCIMGLLGLQIRIGFGIGEPSQVISPLPYTLETVTKQQPLFKNTEPEAAVWTATSVKGVDEATAVVMDEDVFIAAKASNFQRLRLKAIRQEVHQKLKKKFPKYKVHVTTDGKLFDELEKAGKMITIKDYEDAQTIKKKLKKIEKDMKG